MALGVVGDREREHLPGGGAVRAGAVPERPAGGSGLAGALAAMAALTRHRAGAPGSDAARQPASRRPVSLCG
jgi:hypothetical protein